MEERFLLFLRRLPIEVLRLELEHLKHQWHVRILQDEIEVVKRAAVGDVINRRWWQNAINRLEASLEAQRLQVGPAFRCDPGSSCGSRFQCLPESIIVHIAHFLDARSAHRLGETCKQGHASIDTEELWRWRPLNLAHIKTVARWKEALQSGFKSVHWNCATVVVAPKANAIAVALELVTFFKGRLKVLDLSGVHYIAAMDYDYFLRMRHEIVDERPDKVLLPTSAAQGSRPTPGIRRTIGNYLLAEAFFDFCTGSRLL